MKKILLTMIVMCALLCGCANSDYSKCDFVDMTLTRESDVCTEYICFGSDGSFSYYCACGEPVDDSDLCETYSYDDGAKSFTLNYDDHKRQVSIVEDGQDYVSLDFDGEVRTFTKE